MAQYEAKVLEVRKDTSDSYSVILEIPEDYTWKPGQFTMWEYVSHKVDEGDKPGRVFSIASSLEDGYLMFTTRITEQHTSFKDIILNTLKPGDLMRIREANGIFTFHDDKKYSFALAGGIGITPIRSLIRHLSDNNIPDHEYFVIYSDDRGEFCYEDDFKIIKEKMPNLTLHLVSNRDEMSKLMNDYVLEHQNDSEYLIAGSPGMNKAISSILEEKGIEKVNIKTDNFMGY